MEEGFITHRILAAYFARLTISAWILCLVLLMFMPLFSYAEDSKDLDKKSMFSKPSNKESLRALNAFKNKKVGNSGLFVQLSETKFISSDRNYFSSANGNVSLGRAGIGVKKSWLEDTIKSDIFFEHSFAENKNYLYVDELYFSQNIVFLDSKISLGRKVEEWSKGETIWKEGLWQARKSADPLNYKTQGLVGLFYELKQPNFKLTAFTSGFFVPEFDPQYNIEDGKITSNNPWFPSLIEQVEMFGNLNEINYTIQQPKNEDVVQQSSQALKLEYDNGAFHASSSVARKPINRLFLRLPFSQRASEDIVDITVVPVVLTHDLASYSMGYRSKKWKIWFDVTDEKPVLDTPNYDWISQMAGDSIQSTAYAAFMFGGSETYVSYHNLQSDDVADYGEVVEGSQSSIFDPRFQSFNALKVGIKNLKYKQNSLAVEATYDEPQKAGVFKVNYDYHYSEKLAFHVDAALIGLTNESEATEEKGFMRKYRANDYLTSGFTYVF